MVIVHDDGIVADFNQSKNNSNKIMPWCAISFHSLVQMINKFKHPIVDHWQLLVQLPNKIIQNWIVIPFPSLQSLTHWGRDEIAIFV